MHLNVLTVATALTVYGIETLRSPPLNEPQ